ncbi:MAG: hypothetical protein JKY56_22180 [Kofleriaceae bacterium]|nr:hypothetical protein [Kofleriaceae bacterium]
MHSRLLAASLLLLTACGPSAAPKIAGKVSSPTQALNIEALVIPPHKIESVYTVLDQLQQRGDAGDQQSAWQRAHYLLDLFDAVRFGNDAASRSLLARIAGWPADSMTGPGATQAVAELLLLEFDHMLEQSRQHKLGGQGRILANFDLSPPRKRGEVFQRLLELKRIVASEGPLATNARLRLFGYCKNALLDAASYAGQERRVAISHCLYPLYSANPAPYFAEKAENRPPPPELANLVPVMQELLNESRGRLVAASTVQRQWMAEFETSSAFRTGIAVDANLLPFATAALPYDDAPLIGKGLRAALQFDGRGTAALVLPAATPASQTLVAAQAAQLAGAHTMAVVVGMKQKLRVPKGDYWSNRLARDGKSVERAGQLLLSLAPLGKKESTAPQTGVRTKAQGWDPTRAALQLHLLISPTSWRLVSPLGELAAIDTSTKSTLPQETLRTLLSQVRRAFPDEDGLILVPEQKSSHAALVTAALAALHDSQGQRLFSSLAIATSGPVVRNGKAFQKRVKRRARAHLQVSPQSAQSRSAAARACYLRLLDKKGKAVVGQVRIERAADGSAKITGKSRKLNECAQAFTTLVEADGGIAAIAIRFDLGPQS